MGSVEYWLAWPSSKVRLTTVLVAAWAGVTGRPLTARSASAARTNLRMRARLERPDTGPPGTFTTA